MIARASRNSFGSEKRQNGPPTSRPTRHRSRRRRLQYRYVGVMARRCADHASVNRPRPARSASLAFETDPPTPAGDGDAAAFLHGPTRCSQTSSRRPPPSEPSLYSATTNNDGNGTPTQSRVRGYRHDRRTSPARRAAHVEAVRQARDPRSPARPSPSRRTRHIEFPQVLCHDESPAANPKPSPAASAAPSSKPRPPWRASTSLLARTPRRANPRPRRTALARRPREGDPLPAGRGWEEPRRASPRPPRHPARRRRPVHQTSRVLATLAGAHADRSWDKR
jgi:hypothetical protein